LVYKSSDPELSWDGTLNGKPLDTGVYIMKIEAFCPEKGEVYYFTKDLTIIR
jgi:hypothetical protein